MHRTRERLLTLPQVADVADVHYRTLHTWVKRGLLRPAFQSSTGSGTPNLFSAKDALVARVLADLRRAGLELEVLGTVADELRAHDGGVVAEAVLSINGSVRLLDGSQSLDEALDREEAALIYRVARAREIVDGRLGG